MPARCLVINASFTPITTVTWQRAVILVLEGEAEVLEEGEDLVRSQHLTMTMPKVVRLVEFRHIPFKSRSPLTRRGVLARDGGQCAYCERRRGTTIDHIVPRSRGGRHRWENVVACCSTDNHRKGDRTPEEAGMPLRFRPTVPSGLVALVVAIGYVDESWRPYLEGAA